MVNSKMIDCHDSEKSDYKRTECPNKRRFSKKKALQVTQDETDDEDHE